MRIKMLFIGMLLFCRIATAEMSALEYDIAMKECVKTFLNDAEYFYGEETVIYLRPQVPGYCECMLSQWIKSKKQVHDIKISDRKEWQKVCTKKVWNY